MGCWIKGSAQWIIDDWLFVAIHRWPFLNYLFRHHRRSVIREAMWCLLAHLYAKFKAHCCQTQCQGYLTLMEWRLNGNLLRTHTIAQQRLQPNVLQLSPCRYIRYSYSAQMSFVNFWPEFDEFLCHFRLTEFVIAFGAVDFQFGMNSYVVNEFNELLSGQWMTLFQLKCARVAVWAQQMCIATAVENVSDWFFGRTIHYWVFPVNPWTGANSITQCNKSWRI